MKIIVLHQFFLEKTGGGGARWNEMTQVWANEGHEVTVIAGMVNYITGKKPMQYKGKYFYKDKDFYPGVDVLRTHVSEAYNVNFLGRLWAYFSFVFSSIYAGLFMAKGKYDVLIVSSPPLFVGITAYVLKLFRGIPFVFEIRDLWPESAIDTGVVTNSQIIKFAYWFESFIYKKASLINVLTPAFKEKLIKEKNVNKDKIILIPNAADFSLSEKLMIDFDAKEFRRKQGFEDNFVITYVGAHGVANHLIQVIEAAEKLQNTNIIFQLIGSGMEKEMLKKEAEKRKLKNVVFVDPVPKNEVYQYILASDMGASILAKNDTFKTIYSNKTFDYMSCKIPILLLIDGVSRTLVEAADCGVYAEPENINEIVEKVNWCMINQSGLPKMGENGYNYAKNYFDRIDLAKKYIDSIKDKLINVQ